ncbi:MAG: hypothetical protein K6W08_06220 [Firmicutes bacterium]|nr:hypothetical protein [Bacillota bacterium]
MRAPDLTATLLATGEQVAAAVRRGRPPGARPVRTGVLPSAAGGAAGAATAWHGGAAWQAAAAPAG